MSDILQKDQVGLFATLWNSPNKNTSVKTQMSKNPRDFPTTIGKQTKTKTIKTEVPDSNVEKSQVACGEKGEKVDG